MSPGDESYDEPYFYVNPWPRPEMVQPPALDGNGIWHTEGWFGAVLPASRLETGGDARTQAEQVRSYIYSALNAERALLNV